MENQTRSIIKKGLDQLRNKLLDISGRNPLISFRHSDRSKGQIQAVQTPLEAIYAALKEEKEILFKALPEPILEIKFNQELGTNQIISSHITPKEHAIALGLNPSYDLQFGYNGAVEELAIQTMLFPDKFLKKMTGFLDVQKQYIEETGVNCMHACFGFLEWYESPSSKYPIISPLLMVPVYVEREYKRQQSAFLLNSTGEEIRDNPALSERLKKDFGLQLPCIAGASTVQEYFSELKTIIKDQPRWKIQQRLTIGRVSFAKILMYYDLDPNNWPTDDSIFAQPLVRDLFVGSESPSPAGFATDDHLDETDQTSPVPLVISDLDSSQLSAVADAMNLKNFVIEGPPGTGKSQTITNIIAAAMAAGKSVLFVAEKLVALQVVKNRLDAAGLGQFCLELHATKVQKGKFYEELKARLELKEGVDNKLSKKLNLMINEHREIKHKLNLYASTMGMSFGMADRTLHEYFWLYQQRKDALPLEFIEKAESLSLKKASHIPETELLKFNEYATQWISYSQGICKKFGDVKKHPWYGFQSKVCGIYQIKEIHQRIRLLKDRLISLNELANWFRVHVVGQEVSSLSDHAKITDQLQHLSECLRDHKAYNSQIFARIKDQSDIEFLVNFCQQKQRINLLKEELKRFITVSDFHTSKELQELIDHLNLIWSEAVREGLQEWTPFEIDMALQSEQLHELPAEFAIQEFADTMHAVQENQQKWQVCEKECRALISIPHFIAHELANHLKKLLGLAREGCFDHILPDKWEELYGKISVVLQNLGDLSSSDFNDVMLGLPQHLLEEKKILEDLNHFIVPANTLL